jgi:hypothetical protein
MRKPIVTIFYQFNPWHTSLGEIQTVIRSFVKYSPSEVEVRLVGTENDTSQSIGVWQDAELAGKAIRFMPVLTLQNDNFRKLVPTTIKYTAALLGRNLASDFMHFHRLEPSLSVFVLTVAVLEALACGTPVVTTRCGETPNLLSTESGIVCQERTPTAIADALRKVLLHPGDYPIEACVQAAEPYSAAVL